MRTLLVLIIAAALTAAESGHDLFQKALVKERTEGNLAEAIKLYQRIADKFANDKVLAAKALFQMGQCYERLGHADARKTYERVLRQYADQSEVVAGVRMRLAALGGLGHPSGMTLRKVWARDRGELAGAPSPDGRYHSFAELGTSDLSLLDLVTGENRRLTKIQADSPEFAESSVISGDGKQIAYAWYNKEKFYEIRVCGMDGSNVRTVYRDKEFGSWLELHQWSRDGKYILAGLMKREPKDHRIVLVPAAGGPARILPTRTPRSWYPNLSPDGRFVVYSGSLTEADSGSEIFLLPLEGGQEEPIVRQPYGGWGPVWAPDGKAIVFISNRTGTNGFWIVDMVEGKPRGVPRLLKDGLGQEIRPNGFTRQGAFYFATTTRVEDVYVAELDLAAGKVVREPVPVAARLAGSNLAPSWSPDGRRLAYYVKPEWGKPPALTVLSVESGETRNVPLKLEPYLVHVHWFPDGKSVLIGAWESSKHDSMGFHRVDVQTGESRLIFTGLGIGHAELSPDGKTLFHFSPGYAKQRGGVISRDLESGKERELARYPYLGSVRGWARVAVSPDGKHLAFRSPVDERQWTALRLLATEGGEPRELCRLPQSDTEGFLELAWTPDGSNVLMVRRTGKDGMAELWRVPIAGGAPQRTGLAAERMGTVVAPHPDGRRIAFEIGSGSRQPNELWVLENFLTKAAK